MTDKKFKHRITVALLLFDVLVIIAGIFMVYKGSTLPVGKFAAPGVEATANFMQIVGAILAFLGLFALYPGLKKLIGKTPGAPQ